MFFTCDNRILCFFLTAKSSAHKVQSNVHKGAAENVIDDREPSDSSSSIDVVGVSQNKNYDSSGRPNQTDSTKAIALYFHF